jgi:hypothetical protein
MSVGRSTGRTPSKRPVTWACRPGRPIPSGWWLIGILFLAVATTARAQSLSICSFNIQFLGNSKVRDNVGLAEILKDYDLVVVQELLAPPYAGTFPNGEAFKPKPETRDFFDAMTNRGFTNVFSEEDTGPGTKNHLNSSATEWWGVLQAGQGHPGG